VSERTRRERARRQRGEAARLGVVSAHGGDRDAARAAYGTATGWSGARARANAEEAQAAAVALFWAAEHAADVAWVRAAAHEGGPGGTQAVRDAERADDEAAAAKAAYRRANGWCRVLA
jgi:hypothetical protein